MFKICNNCNEKNPPRKRRCKKCNNIFCFKVKKKKDKKIKINWEELREGDLIKVSGGPVFLKKETKEEVSMGYNGLFSVYKIDENGIQAFGRDKFSGFCHIWMKDEQKINEVGIIKKPHSVYKLKQKD